MCVIIAINNNDNLCHLLLLQDNGRSSVLFE